MDDGEKVAYGVVAHRRANALLDGGERAADPLANRPACLGQLHRDEAARRWMWQALDPAARFEAVKNARQRRAFVDGCVGR